MKTATIREIFVDWSGPYSYSEIIDNISKDGFSVKPSDFGIYQIYGSHNLYGENVLIYIGKTEQMFCNRLKGRGVIVDNQDFHNVQIYLGQIFYDDILEHLELNDDISRAESLLIHYHKPAHNSSNINSLRFAEEEIKVINVGSYRRLQGEVSTQAFTKEVRIYSMIDEIGKKLNIKKSLYYDDEDSYGFWLNGDDNDNMRFGIDYDLWNGNIMLVLIVTEQLNSSFIDYFENNNEQLFYKPLNGSIDEIVKEIQKYSK